MSSDSIDVRQQTLFGHPTGLFTLFFAEMWERFSYYGMRALLVFYMLYGFLRYSDRDSYAVYGAYTAMVYMTPFFGGLLADRLLGQRRAVIFGGMLMAAGHLMMTVETSLGFFTALALLICGNGFFKPNISTIVGSLYAEGSHKRDGGFTIFYMGINLGAAMSPLLCGYIGQTWGWHYGFGLATIGMLTGIAVFVAPSLPAQIAMSAVSVAAAVNVFCFESGGPASTRMNVAVLVCLALAGFGSLIELGRRDLRESALSRLVAAIVIAVGAGTAVFGLLWYRPENPFSSGFNIFVAVSLLVAAVVACAALARGGLPKDAGAAPDPEYLRRPRLGPISAEWLTYLGTAVAVVIFVLLVSGFAPLTADKQPLAIIPDTAIQSLEAGSPLAQAAAVVLREISRPAGLVLMLAGLVAFGYLGLVTIRLEKVPRERMFVVLILMFFSMLFWAFFEQQGSSVNNFTDRNVDLVAESRKVEPSEVGHAIRIQPTQEQLGYTNGKQLFTLDVLNKLREEHKNNPDFTIDWKVTKDDVGMGIASRIQEVPASTLQSVNAIYIIIFGLVFTALWAILDRWGLQPSTPVKFSLGLLQLGMGFAALWYGALVPDARGMVAISWLMLAYLLITTGELCLSPVGLSMVTKLSPTRLVSTVMGGWFLATAFSLYLAGIIAQFTDVGRGEGHIPLPKETVDVYGGVFGKIAIAAVVSALVCLLLSPLLSHWMHPEAVHNEAE